eukprot:2484011-Amphidinium_carterae.1
MPVTVVRRVLAPQPPPPPTVRTMPAHPQQTAAETSKQMQPAEPMTEQAGQKRQESGIQHSTPDQTVQGANAT